MLVGTGPDVQDSTCKKETIPDYARNLRIPEQMDSRPLEGKRLAIISDTLGEGVDASVSNSVKKAAVHMEKLGATVDEVCFIFPCLMSMCA